MLAVGLALLPLAGFGRELRVGVSGSADVSFVAPLIVLGSGFEVETGSIFRAVADYPKVSLP